jgi:hypothetical protein
VHRREDRRDIDTGAMMIYSIYFVDEERDGKDKKE